MDKKTAKPGTTVQYKLDLNIGSLRITADWRGGMLSVDVLGDDSNSATSGHTGSYTCLKDGTWFSNMRKDFLSGDTVLHAGSGITLHKIGQASVDQRYREELMKALEIIP